MDIRSSLLLRDAKKIEEKMAPKRAAAKQVARQPGEPTTGDADAAGSDAQQQGSAEYRAQGPEVLAEIYIQKSKKTKKTRTLVKDIKNQKLFF